MLLKILIKLLNYIPHLPKLFKRGNIKNLLGDYEGAITDYSKAIELNPNLAEAYHNRGLTKFRSGNEQAGNLDFLKAGMLGYIRAYDINKEFCN